MSSKQPPSQSHSHSQCIESHCLTRSNPRSEHSLTHAPCPSAVDEEAQSLRRVLSAFFHYKSHSLSLINKRRHDYYSLNPQQKALIPNYSSKLNAVEECMGITYAFVEKILDLNGREDGSGIQENGFLSIGLNRVNPEDGNANNIPNINMYPRPTGDDMDKVRSTLKLLVRDWAQQGKSEREASYQPLLDLLLLHFAHVPIDQRGRVRVLVPGCGLGRLPFEVAHLGFSCQGNEFAFFMLEKVTIPDVLPSDIPNNVDFSLVAGDFIECYSSEEDCESFDAVMTCFFLDTAKNILDYLSVIRNVLKTGGVWINLGPLLWHWEGTAEISIELSWEELQQLIVDMGFKLVSESTHRTTYSGNPNAMLQYVYDCVGFVAMKI